MEMVFFSPRTSRDMYMTPLCLSVGWIVSYSVCDTLHGSIMCPTHYFLFRHSRFTVLFVANDGNCIL